MVDKRRREFLEGIGITSALLVGASWFGFGRVLADAATPDMIVVNARITTMDAAKPRAQAFAVKAGRFTAVGTTEQIKTLAGPKTQVYDAKGMMVVPTFNDTHSHGGGVILLYDVLVGNPFGVEYVPIPSIIDKPKGRAAKTPPGYWVEGFYFDDAKVKDNRALTAKDLDQVS